MGWFIIFKSESWNWVRSSRFPAPVRPKGHLNQMPCSIILHFSPSRLGQLCELCSAPLSLAKAGSCCICVLVSFEGLLKCWETQGRVVLVQGLCCTQQQTGEPREKMKMGNHSQISRRGRSLLRSGMEVRRVHASLRGQKMMLNQPRQAFSG